MRIVWTRRISQLFFLVLFLWFCLVATVGNDFHQLRGWPVNWFLQLDPLAALGTLLSTHTLYRGLVWALLTFILTVLFGRFFCGWVCPFGTLHQACGFLFHGRKSRAEQLALNRYHPLQRSKYLLLLFFLAMALWPGSGGLLLSGLLDPLPLLSRSVNLILLPLVDAPFSVTSVIPRHAEGSVLLLTVVGGALLLNLVRPRFYCRFLCPLGALFGLISRLSLFRIGKSSSPCSECQACERHCEGGCHPSGAIRTSECLLCCNCIDPCPDEVMTYQALCPPAEEETTTDLSRRGFTLSLGAGLLTVPVFGLSGRQGRNWRGDLIRPPGALAESEFLKRCLKCDQCIRVCPTNVLQPLGSFMELDTLWTPALNNRIGSSGCQYNCVACSTICPTGAIRPISLEEKQGLGPFSDRGPIRIGTAFLDRGRCLPWAMDRPCLVCQENCPLSPKAIFTREYFSTLRSGRVEIQAREANRITVRSLPLAPGQFATAEYFCLLGSERIRLLASTASELILESTPSGEQVTPFLEIQIRLQRPYVAIDRCIGCGICEHECPVSGKRAIRVSAEGESRSPEHRLLLSRNRQQEEQP